MKYRIIKNGLNQYRIQKKISFFHTWEDTGLEANNYLRAIIFLKELVHELKEKMRKKKLRKELTVVYIYDSDYPKCFEHDACIYAESSCLKDK